MFVVMSSIDYISFIQATELNCLPPMLMIQSSKVTSNGNSMKCSTCWPATSFTRVTKKKQHEHTRLVMIFSFTYLVRVKRKLIPGARDFTGVAIFRACLAANKPDDFSYRATHAFLVCGKREIIPSGINQCSFRHDPNPPANKPSTPKKHSI